MNKERPTELNKKIKRLRTSRDGLKLNNGFRGDGFPLDFLEGEDPSPPLKNKKKK